MQQMFFQIDFFSPLPWLPDRKTYFQKTFYYHHAPYIFFRISSVSYLRPVFIHHFLKKGNEIEFFICGRKGMLFVGVFPSQES